jgi:hypothetical protein
LTLDLSFLKNSKGSIITSGVESPDEPSFNNTPLIITSSGKINVTLKANDGFVAVFE